MHCYNQLSNMPNGIAFEKSVKKIIVRKEKPNGIALMGLLVSFSGPNNKARSAENSYRKP